MTLTCTGHRPDKLPDAATGYDHNNPHRKALRRLYAQVLRDLAPDVLISGMALGVDQDLAWVAVEAGISLWAALPFKGQDWIWTPRQRRLYEHLLSRAWRIDHVCEPGYAPWKMLRRNVWMLEHAERLLAVWNGDASGGTAHCVRAAQKRGMAITRIDPGTISIVDI